jgi:hypothetical protein
VTLDVEVIVDGGMDGQKSLGGAGGFETLHLSLSSSYKLM